MPSLADIPTTWPPPATVVLSNSKDEISAVRVTLLRLVTLRALAAFVQGSGAGNATPQEGKFAVYSHDAGTNRPDALLEESAPVLIGRNDPLRGINPVPLLSPLDLDPGTYWIALHLAPLAGQGKWQVRGLPTGGASIGAAPALYSAGVPDPFPAGGTVGTSRLGLGGVVSPRSVAEGAVVGTFIVGDGTLVGQPPAPAFNDPVLLLNGKAVEGFTFDDLDVVTPLKPKLILKTKQVTVMADSVASVGKAVLLLNGKAVITLVPSFAHMAKSSLVLRGKPFVLGISAIENMGKPTLILKGKPYIAGEVGLVPTPPTPPGLEINLFPAIPVSVDLVPTVPESRDLVPTVEEFR